MFIEDDKILSNQHIYFQNGKIRFMMKEAKLKKEYYAYVIKEQWNRPPSEKNMKMIVDLYFHDNRRRDCDNYGKIILDSLIGVCYIDDSQIQELTFRKTKTSRDKAGINIIIEEI